MPRGMPKNVKNMTAYSTQLKTIEDVADALRSHFRGYIAWKGLDSFIAQLPTRFQQAIILCYGEQRTIEETAEVMGCSVWAVNDYLKRTKERLLGWSTVSPY